jgi:type IV pilus assembly protein PilW
MKMPNTLHNKGYTLVEIMIAMTIGLILVLAASASYIVQNRSSVAQESVSEINTQSKIAIDLISNDIKSAGFGVSVDLNEEPVNNFTSIITPVDNTTQPDAITIVGGFRLIGTLWPAGPGPVLCPASVTAGTTDVRITYSGTDGPNLTDKAYLSIDGIETVQVLNCTLDADGICDSANNITLDRPLSQDFPLQNSTVGGTCNVAAAGGNCVAGRPVYLVEDVTFCIDNFNTLRRIRRNADPAACTAPAASDNDAIAENIEDLQLAYAIDADGDRMADDQNASGSFDAGDFLDGAAVADPGTIKALRINVLAMSDRVDKSFTGLGNPPAVIENRNHNSTNDDFRRRWWQTVATIRNQ